jgi:hypothetical protein
MFARFFDGVRDLDMTRLAGCLPRRWFKHPVVAGVGDVESAAAVHRHPGWSIFDWWVSSMSDQVRAWERPGARWRSNVTGCRR